MQLNSLPAARVSGPAPCRSRGPTSWVVYRAVVKGEAAGPNGVCEQAELEAMERARPGCVRVIRAGLLDEGAAERLARGTAGDPKPRLGRGLAP